uniref:Mitogen-activated protein kinase kinase kinase 15 n=1 Tax=Aceria tosichella TaxID=561515 RepID=A0A6G1SA56_9ACAR
MSDKFVKFSDDATKNDLSSSSQSDAIQSSTKATSIISPSSTAVGATTTVVAYQQQQQPLDSSIAKTIEQRRNVSPSISPSRQRINIVFIVDLELNSITLRHRKSALGCIKSVCDEMGANLLLVHYNELNQNVSTALDAFYDADAAILDISIEEQRNTLFYHLGVRESFSMKQNILLVANLIDCPKLTNDDTQSSSTSSGQQYLSHEAASQTKKLLPNYPLFVYSIRQDVSSSEENSDDISECFVDQCFIDLTYSPGSDEQIDPSYSDFAETTFTIDEQQQTKTSGLTNNAQDNAIAPSGATTTTSSECDHQQQQQQQQQDPMKMSLNLKGQLKEALKNVKWQAKAHMKDKFLADLKKARRSYQGEELYKILHEFRRRLDDPNMLSTEVVYQMLVSFKEVQDYDAMVQLVDDLGKYPNLAKITSSPEIVFHHAFALNRRHKSGDSDRALTLITNALATKEHQIPDSICLCGRIFKDRFIESDYEDRDSLKNAINWYRKGFKISPNEYAAINLATLLYIAGHDFNSSDELKHVGLVLNNLIGKKGPVHKLDDYWDVATYFEFCLLANQFAKAIEAASCMFNLKPSKWHLKSTIGNIRLIYRFKPKPVPEHHQQQQQHQHQHLQATGTNDDGSSCPQEIIQSPEEQIVEFWMDFFIDALLDSCENQIRFASLVLEQNNEYMPTYITLNLDAEEKSITISQMCILHMRDLNACRKPHLWHIKASGIRGLSLYKRDERCVFLYVHDNSDDFQIFFPSEAIRARFRALVLSITGDQSIDISENLGEPERSINFVYELDTDGNRIVLGRGSKGVVYAARDVDTQTQIAIKEVPVKNIGEVQPLHEEIRLHSMLRHKNIVQYLGTSHESNYFRIIMERVPGGSLSQLLQRKWGPLNEKAIAYYSKQILEGLQYLHRQKIVHRDIKGDNVLVNPYTGSIKISDFGTCKRLAAINPNTETFAGTVPFMAPELLDRGQRGYSMPADIWSFGCTVVEMATGKPPFIEIGSGAQVMFRVGFYKEHPEVPAQLSDKCKQFILRCFEPNTEHRATCDELLQDAFLDETRPSSFGKTPLPRLKPRSHSLTASNENLDSPLSTPDSPNPFGMQTAWSPTYPTKDDGSQQQAAALPSIIHSAPGDDANILELNEEDDDDDDDDLDDKSEADDITLVQTIMDNGDSAQRKRGNDKENSFSGSNNMTDLADMNRTLKLGESIRKLATENHKLREQLYLAQSELNELLRLQLEDTKWQLSSLRKMCNKTQPE